MASPDHTIAPAGCGRRDKRPTVPAGRRTARARANPDNPATNPATNPGGAQNALAGQAICYKLSVKTPSCGREFAFFREKQTRKQ